NGSSSAEVGDSALGLARLPDGDIVAVGIRGDNDDDSLHPSMVRIRTTDGEIVWQSTLAVHGRVATTVVDGEANVIVGGDTVGPLSFFVAKIDGASGQLIWSNSLLPGDVRAVAIEDDGRTILAAGGR